MYKHKKKCINIITIIYLILSLIELIKYLLVSSTLYGLIYLLVNLFIIFLLIPVTYNYKKYYSMARISKLILIIIIGIINSYFLSTIVLNSMSYVDDSSKFIDSIFVIKNILKGILYGLILLFTLSELKSDKLLENKLIIKLDKSKK